MDTLFKSSSNFTSLSLKDLIEARDLFHYHLMNKKNVVATALGLYRIRKSDPWPTRERRVPAHAVMRPASPRRTLFNSEVRPYSWPCVYVFVSSWEENETLAAHDPSDVVPRTLYLPDGRTVPVCVIEARRQPYATDLKVRPDGATPRNLLEPGCAIVNTDAQGMTRIATAGCIVRDGERYYILTNRHAVGDAGTVIGAWQGHREPDIGVTAEKGLTREDLAAVYPAFPAARQRLLMDIGLVAVDDITQWKTEIPGIAPVGPVLDLYDNSLSLKLITMKVVGRSAISGLIRGEIHGLLYRYKAMGGSEYISDFLIGPETYDKAAPGRFAESQEGRKTNISLGVHHGDSGTLLMIEHAPEYGEGGKPAKPVYYPFAVLWGKEQFFEKGATLSHPFALATSLSIAFDRLDLDLVRDINMDQPYVWGWVGHYMIGRDLALPTDLLSKKLRAFIGKNADALALNPAKALGNDPRAQKGPGGAAQFVPLADVPDNVWKSNVNFTMVDGSDHQKHHKPGPGNRGKDDNKNHFADLDVPYKESKTFLALNQADPDKYLNPKAWVAYFAAMKPKYDEWAKLMHKGADHADAHWGALPFRVHQLFDIMVAAVRAKDQKLFLCAGGVLIHYIGDACQPLHASYLSQGDPARVVRRKTGTFKLEADQVHSGYEDDMIAYGFQQDDLAARLAAQIEKLKSEKIKPITSGNAAAKAVIDLVAATQKDIRPRDIVDKWVMLAGKGKAEKSAAMWKAFGVPTARCMARGTRYLAAIWQAAWEKGGGDKNIGEGAVVDHKALMKLYNDPDIMPSIGLDQYPDNAAADWSTIKRAAKG